MLLFAGMGGGARANITSTEQDGLDSQTGTPARPPRIRSAALDSLVRRVEMMIWSMSCAAMVSVTAATVSGSVAMSPVTVAPRLVGPVEAVAEVLCGEFVAVGDYDRGGSLRCRSDRARRR